jgi:hypothetical protein
MEEIKQEPSENDDTRDSLNWLMAAAATEESISVSTNNYGDGDQFQMLKWQMKNAEVFYRN